MPVGVNLGGGGVALSADEVEDGFFAGQLKFLVMAAGALAGGGVGIGASRAGGDGF
jgi:hypothetical protein